MSDAILEVLNVGQGDCLLINPVDCMFDKDVLLIDTGPGNNDFTSCLSGRIYSGIQLLITHHDYDHMGGFKYLLKPDIFNKIKKIYLPFYQNEITLIAKSLLKLKGTLNSLDCNEFINALEQLVNNQMLFKSIIASKNGVFNFLCEGESICNHIKCLNPPCPLDYDTEDWIDKLSEDDFSKIAHEIFTNDFAPKINNYFKALKGGYALSNSIISNELFIRDLENQFNYYQNEERIKGNLYISFIMKNLSEIQRFNDTPSRKNMRIIYNIFVACTHDVCLVLKAKYKEKKYLLTGDASIKAFKWMIDNGNDLSADILKVPHHGSRKNLNSSILNIIKPKYAIISHDNRKFGNSKDSHPNVEVLKLLDKKGIQILITNDVIKDGVVIMEKSSHCIDNSFISIK